MAQVRLDADVEDALRALVARDGGSVAQAANRTLRRSLGLHSTGWAATKGNGTAAIVSAKRRTIGRRAGL